MSAKYPCDREGPPRNKTTELSFILKPSRLQGVGVFSTHAIAAGINLRLFPGLPSRFIREREAVRDGMLLAFCQQYGVYRNSGYYIPNDFGTMDMVWYLNESDNPNAYHDDEWNWIATRDIAAGEEVTISYEDL